MSCTEGAVGNESFVGGVVAIERLSSSFLLNSSNVLSVSTNEETASRASKAVGLMSVLECPDLVLCGRTVGIWE